MEAVKPESPKDSTHMNVPETATGDTTIIDDKETSDNMAVADQSSAEAGSNTSQSSEVTAEGSEESKTAPTMIPEQKDTATGGTEPSTSTDAADPIPIPSSRKDSKDGSHDTMIKTTSPLLRALSAIKNIFPGQANVTTDKEQPKEAPKDQITPNLDTITTAPKNEETIKTAVAQNEATPSTSKGELAPSTSKDEPSPSTQMLPSTGAIKKDPAIICSSSKDSKSGFVATMAKMFSSTGDIKTDPADIRPPSTESKEGAVVSAGEQNLSTSAEDTQKPETATTDDKGASVAILHVENEEKKVSGIDKSNAAKEYETTDVEMHPNKSQHYPQIAAAKARTPTHVSPNSEEKLAISRLPNRILIKIVVIGDVGAGKTTLIKRYTKRIFVDNFHPTIGADFSTKLVRINSNTAAQLYIHDIAGQQRLSHITRAYYRNSNAAMIVFDESKIDKIGNVLKWKEDLDNNVQLPDGKPVPCVLIGNKSDLLTPQERKDKNQSQFAADNGFVKFFETSAVLGTGIDEAMDFIIKKLMDESVPRLVGIQLQLPTQPPRRKCAGMC